MMVNDQNWPLAPPVEVVGPRPYYLHQVSRSRFFAKGNGSSCSKLDTHAPGTPIVSVSYSREIIRIHL